MIGTSRFKGEQLPYAENPEKRRVLCAETSPRAARCQVILSRHFHWLRGVASFALAQRKLFQKCGQREYKKDAAKSIGTKRNQSERKNRKKHRVPAMSVEVEQRR